MLRLLAALLVCATAASQAPPVLILDANPTGGDQIVSTNYGVSDDATLTFGGPVDQHLVEYRGELYFTVTGADGNREVWVSNGTAEGTAPLLVGPRPSAPNLFVRTHGRLYFSGLVGSRQNTYVTDGHDIRLLLEDVVPQRRLESTTTPALLLRGTLDDAPAILGNCRRDGSGGPICAAGPFATTSGAIQLTEDITQLFFRASSDGDLYKSFGNETSTESILGGQLGEDLEQPSAPMATSDRVFFSCRWTQGGIDRGREMCTSQGLAGQASLAADIRPGQPSSSPVLLGVYGDRVYFRARTDDSPTRDVVFRTTDAGTVERLSDPGGVEPDFGFNVRFFELRGEVYYSGFTSAGGARVWRDGEVVASLPDLRNGHSDGETAYFVGREASSDPFQIYTFDGTTLQAVADVPPEGFTFSHPTPYNGGLVYSNGDNLYSYDVRPRAARRTVADAPAGGVVFEVFAGETAQPARFVPTAGVAAGQLRVSRLSAARESIPAPNPSLLPLDGYYHLGVDPGLEGLRGDLTLAYTAADLAEAGADAAGLGVWQWSVDGQEWVARPVTARADRTVTVSDITPVDFFVLGSDQPVSATDRPRADGSVLHAPAPNPTTGRSVVRYDLAVAGPVRLTVHDLLGREVAVVAEGHRVAGAHRASLEASALAPGLYLLRLDAPDGAQTTRLTLAR